MSLMAVMKINYLLKFSLFHNEFYENVFRAGSYLYSR
jgi:hypothetical protein